MGDSYDLYEYLFQKMSFLLSKSVDGPEIWLLISWQIHESDIRVHTDCNGTAWKGFSWVCIDEYLKKHARIVCASTFEMIAVTFIQRWKVQRIDNIWKYDGFMVFRKKITERGRNQKCLILDILFKHTLLHKKICLYNTQYLANSRGNMKMSSE